MTTNRLMITIPVLALMVIGFQGTAWADLCGGPLENNNFNRPLDYTSDQDKYGFGEGQKNKLALVENFHFNSDVEMLVSGLQGPLPGDIHYTLKHFPNHYRALHSMAKWHLQNPNPVDEECDCIRWLLPAECYFTRAITFRPDDPTLYYIFGIYLHQKGELDAALNAYTDATNLGLAKPEFEYNFGLLLVDLKNYELARVYARKAYSNGVPFPGLRNKLKRLGEWQPE
jgi:tetratricopeptide (TPR) repeat protein